MAERKTIVRTESLATDRVIGHIDDDIVTCPICMNILWKPIACKTCENSFCLKCIRLWLNEKPNACPFNCQFQQRNPPPILMKLLSKLKLQCQNESNGCTLLIPYEALEKHELVECSFRLTQCPDCSRAMLYKDLEGHQNNDCLPKQVTCLKCDTVYYQKDGHELLDCLKKQGDIVEKAIDACTRDPSKLSQSWQRVSRLYRREQQNEDYALRRQSFNDPQDFAPSAPIYEPPTPERADSQPSAVFLSSTDGTASSKPSNTSLRISTINFSLIPNSKKEGSHIPNGYAGFNWENIYYMYKQHVDENIQLSRFLNAFSGSRQCIAFNGRGNAMSVFLPHSRNTFGLHSFEAMSTYHSSFDLTVTGYRANVVFAVKNVSFTNKKPVLFEINWENLDKIVFTPGKILHTVKPETFVLTCLNLIL